MREGEGWRKGVERGEGVRFKMEGLKGVEG